MKDPFTLDEFAALISLLPFVLLLLVIFKYGMEPSARPNWQLFGCKETYINAKGEDTGECQ